MKHTAEFTLDTTLPDAKSVSTDDDSGDIIIEGYASDFGLDRQDEAFLPGAFQRSVKRFLDTNPVLLYHHDEGKALGQVLELEPRGEGLFMKARIDKPTTGGWAEDVVAKVKRGTIKGLSVRGIFKRVMTAAGPRIEDADLAEISVTPLPVNPRTLFAVAQKAFGEDAFDPEIARDNAEAFAQDCLIAYETFAEETAKSLATKSSFKPWNGSPGRFSDEQYRKSAVLDRGEGYEGKARYALPVREPDGELNCRAVAQAKARINQVKGASAEAKAAAKRKLDKLSDECERGHGAGE